MQEDIGNEELLKEFPPYEVENLTKEEILGDTVINYLLSLEDLTDRTLAIEKVRDKAREEKVLRPFNALLKEKEKVFKKSSNFGEKNIVFPEMEDVEYITSKYELDSSGRI